MSNSRLQNDSSHANLYVQLYNIRKDSMNYVIDTSIIISVIINKEHQKTLAKLNIYVYDAYVIGCALKHKYPILTLDEGLMRAAKKAGATIRKGSHQKKGRGSLHDSAGLSKGLSIRREGPQSRHFRR